MNLFVNAFFPYCFPIFLAADIFQIGGFLVELGALHFDLPNLAAFVQRTELARKVPVWKDPGVNPWLTPPDTCERHGEMMLT